MWTWILTWSEHEHGYGYGPGHSPYHVHICLCDCRVHVCVLVPVMLVSMFMSMCEFYHAHFNGLVCQRTTFSAYNPGIAGNGEHSAIILTHSMDQNNRSYFLKVTWPALQSSRYLARLSFKQCCGSGSIRIRIIYQDPDPGSVHRCLGSGSGSISCSNEHKKVTWKGKFNKLPYVKMNKKCCFRYITSLKR
jgi:hypothetical protein